MIGLMGHLHLERKVKVRDNLRDVLLILLETAHWGRRISLIQWAFLILLLLYVTLMSDVILVPAILRYSICQF